MNKVMNKVKDIFSLDADWVWYATPIVWGMFLFLQIFIIVTK